MRLFSVALCALFLFGCAISEKESSMSQYAYQVEKAESSGVVTYMEHAPESRFKVPPRQYAENLITTHCPEGHDVVKESRENKAFHFGYVAANNTWKIISYKCKGPKQK